MGLFPGSGKSSVRRTTQGYLKCSTEAGTFTAHTSIRADGGWKKIDAKVGLGTVLQLGFAKMRIGPVGYEAGRPPDTQYLRLVGESPAENAPADYDIGFSVPVHVARIGWLDWTSSSGYCKRVVEDLYEIWRAVADGKDLTVTFNGFESVYNQAYARQFFIPYLCPAEPKPLRATSGPSWVHATDADPDDAIPF